MAVGAGGGQWGGAGRNGPPEKSLGESEAEEQRDREGLGAH